MKQHLLLFSLLFTAGISQAETVTLELLNGDSITGTIVEELSDDQEKILDHPQLGRLTIRASSLKPTSDPPAWSTSITAGLIGNEKDGDSSLSTSLNAESKYKNDKNILVFKAGLNTNQSQDKGEPLDIKTQKGSAGFRYDYRLNDDFSFYSLTDYNIITISGTTLHSRVKVRVPTAGDVLCLRVKLVWHCPVTQNADMVVSQMMSY